MSPSHLNNNNDVMMVLVFMSMYLCCFLVQTFAVVSHSSSLQQEHQSSVCNGTRQGRSACVGQGPV